MSISNNMNKIPTPDELRKDVSDFLKSRYGDKVVVPPEPDAVGNEPGEKKETPKKPNQINFDLKPTELESYLNQYIVGPG